jgi:S-adenosylmethionine decarboxylase proenzyme
MKKVLGRQVLLEFYGCRRERLDNVKSIETAMLEAARRARATVVQATFNRFSPHGVSGVVVIAESHLAIHTWPEHGYAAIDIFTCGSKVLPEVACQYLMKTFKPREISRQDIDRGRVEELRDLSRSNPSTGLRTGNKRDPQAPLGESIHEASAAAG